MKMSNWFDGELRLIYALYEVDYEETGADPLEKNDTDGTQVTNDDQETAIEHAVNHHDALVEMLDEALSLANIEWGKTSEDADRVTELQAILERLNDDK